MVAGVGPWGLGGCWAVILFCPLVLMALLFKHRKCRFILTWLKVESVSFLKYTHSPHPYHFIMKTLKHIGKVRGLMIQW